MASLINVKIVEDSRAFYFITEYDIQHTYTSVDVDVLPIQSAKRFYTGILVNILESDNYSDAIQKLENRIGLLDAGPGNTGGSGGHISIVDIEPTSAGNVGSKVLSQDNHRLESAISDTDLVRVHIVALPGPVNYKPNVTIDGISVSLTEENDSSLWSGYADVQVADNGLILAEHEDGAFDSAVILVESQPVVSSVLFLNGYPLGQTELKEDDIFALRVDTDNPIVRIEVMDQGATKYSDHTFAATTSKLIYVPIANRGDMAALRGASVRVYSESGSMSAAYTTDSSGSTNGIHLVLCNNLHPTVSIDGIDYPPGQQALKGSETADIAVSYFNTDTVLFSSPNNELGIVDASLIESIKEVSRIAGTYNTSIDNISITAVRTANAASTSAFGIIYIANITPIVSTAQPHRLRSGGNQGTVVQSHTITLTSNQELLAAPLMDSTIGAGSFTGLWVGSEGVYSRELQVHDNDPKGTFSFINFSATNLAGVITSAISGSLKYELGGFVGRDIYFDSMHPEKSIGTNVSDYTKLYVLDKDLIQMSFQSSFSNGVRRYTIVEPSNTLNSEGSILFWMDHIEVINNTTSGAFIRIEETL